MVLTWAVWMIGSAVHYTFLPRCLSRSLVSVVNFAIMQAALTGVVSWTMRKFRQTTKQTHQADAGDAVSTTFPDNRANILIAGAAFAVAITMTNASVAYGSVSGSRMIKSLEPAIVSGIQLMAGMDQRADFPWVCLLAVAVSLMLSVAPTGITMLSATAALMSTAGISTRNVFVKRHMLMAKACATSSPGSEEKACAGGALSLLSFCGGSRWTTDAQTSLNFVACTVLIAVATGGLELGGSESHRQSTAAKLDVVIALSSFAAFQVAALMVLERVSPTRQAAIKSLQNALTTAWALVIESKSQRHSSLEIVPALVWGVCVAALTTDAQLRTCEAIPSGQHALPMSGVDAPSVKGGHAAGANADKGGKQDDDSHSRIAESFCFCSGVSQCIARMTAKGWMWVYCACVAVIVLQCAVMTWSRLMLAII